MFSAFFDGTVTVTRLLIHNSTLIFLRWSPSHRFGARRQLEAMLPAKAKADSSFMKIDHPV